MIPYVAAPMVAQSGGGSIDAPISERSMLGKKLDSIVANAQSKTGGELGIVIWDLETDVLIERNSDQAFPLAGLFRLAIGLTAFEQIDAGKLDPTTAIVLTPAELAAGDSHLTVSDLIERTIAGGDDSAADVLYKTVGGADAINAALRSVNVDGMIARTDDAGLAADAQAGRSFAEGGDNAGSPAAVALLLSELARGSILSDRSRSAFLDALLHAKERGTRLAAGLPPGTRFAHASGTSARFHTIKDATNDAGIATINGRNVVIVAMLAHAKGPDAVLDRILADVADAAWNASARVMP